MKDAGCHGNGACATQDNVTAVVQRSVLHIDCKISSIPYKCGALRSLFCPASERSLAAGLNPEGFLLIWKKLAFFYVRGEERVPNAWDDCSVCSLSLWSWLWPKCCVKWDYWSSGAEVLWVGARSSGCQQKALRPRVPTVQGVTHFPACDWASSLQIGTWFVWKIRTTPCHSVYQLWHIQLWPRLPGDDSSASISSLKAASPKKQLWEATLSCDLTALELSSSLYSVSQSGLSPGRLHSMLCLNCSCW